MEVVADSGPSFRNNFKEEANKLGIKVKHSSAYNSSSQAAVEQRVGQQKSVLKKCGPLNQLQIHKMIFCINCREQKGGAGSPIARFLGRDVRGSIPNSFNRDLNWKLMMESRKQRHQQRVEKKGRKPKEQYSVGMEVLVQDMLTKQ